MEVLNKITLSLLIIVFVSTNIISQNQLSETFSKSYSLEKKGEYKKAADVLKEIYDKDFYEVNLRLGWLNYQSGFFSESIAHYQRALTLRPYSEEAKFGLIYPYSAIGKWDKVIELYKKILENSPNNTIANYRLGLLYYGRKEYNKALNYFKVVVDLYPFDHDSLLMLAWSNFQLSKFRESKVLFNKVLLNTPNDESALEGLKLIR